jgi:deoxyribose-phosphate aldolase
MQILPQNIREVIIQIENLVQTQNLISPTSPPISLPKNFIQELRNDPSRISSFIDHTALQPTVSNANIQDLCREAIEHEFFSVCIPASFLSDAQDYLQKNTRSFRPKTCVVIGFPLGNCHTQAKIAEMKACLEMGVDEIDMVIHVGWLKDKQYEKILQELQILRSIDDDVTIKVILETCYLSNEEIAAGCLLAKLAKMNFVKTSTGFGTGGATIEHVELMHRLFGDVGKVKASGGIRNFEDAIAFLQAGAERLGCSKGVSIVNGLQDGLQDESQNSY